MKIDFKGLLEGIKNSIFPAKEIKEEIEQTAKNRMSICESCEFYSPNAEKNGYKSTVIRPDIHCTNCGCNLHWKTRCLSCSCPLAKWNAYITEAEEQALVKKLKESEKSNP